jgi:hypothetical protein
MNTTYNALVVPAHLTQPVRIETVDTVKAALDAAAKNPTLPGTSSGLPSSFSTCRWPPDQAGQGAT